MNNRTGNKGTIEQGTGNIEIMVSTNHKPETRNHSLVIGMSDGLIVPFALNSALSTITDSNNTIIIAGMTAVVAGALAMGFGGYIAGKPAIEHHQMNKDQHEADINQTKKFFANLGLSDELQQQAADEVNRDKDKWEEVIKNYQPENFSKNARPGKTGLEIGVSYGIGGIIPVAPYFFLSDLNSALIFSSAITLICLFALGWYKGSITGSRPIASALFLCFIGAAAAAAAIGVARLVEN